MMLVTSFEAYSDDGVAAAEEGILDWSMVLKTKQGKRMRDWEDGDDRWLMRRGRCGKRKGSVPYFFPFSIKLVNIFYLFIFDKTSYYCGGLKPPVNIERRRFLTNCHYLTASIFLFSSSVKTRRGEYTLIYFFYKLKISSARLISLR
jgi:hypothetical protein